MATVDNSTSSPGATLVMSTHTLKLNVSCVSSGFAVYPVSVTVLVTCGTVNSPFEGTATPPIVTLGTNPVILSTFAVYDLFTDTSNLVGFGSGTVYVAVRTLLP